MKKTEQAADRIVVFWSWQSDSPATTNQTFIQKCLEKACKNVGREDTMLIDVDRDTKGVGGSPGIVETILRKVRSAAVFVWDATLVTKRPKAAPNSNVVFELGYAFAVLGEGRIVGVDNVAGKAKNAKLPFDLVHRRWPLTYSLAEAESERTSIADALVKDLAGAIRAALAEPKVGALRADTDLHAATHLWASIDSQAVLAWKQVQLNAPQRERDSTFQLFERYRDLADKPENMFGRYLSVTAMEMIPESRADGVYVLTAKKSSGLTSAEYDAEYGRQITAVSDAIEAVWEAWQGYVRELAERYPEVVR